MINKTKNKPKPNSKPSKIVKPDYEKAYNILIEYFDSIADEEKPKVDKLLKRCGL